jgi:MinD-like ATPase involved in chromosome partitioning or flagellar assembly
MTYRDQTWGADAIGNSTGPSVLPPASQQREPADTSFTATPAPDVPLWQHAHGGLAANELGLKRSARKIPRRGWRRFLHRITGGTVNLGESAAESRHRAVVERVNRPVRGSYSVAVMSLKGGVGKTTTTACLGAAFASSRGDRVIAVDANPDFGTLAQRGPNQTRSTVRNLLSDGQIRRYTDIRRHTSQSVSRLEFLASERDPAVSEAFSEDDYRAVHGLLDRFYNIILTDCGTGLTHSAMRGVLDTADGLIVVASPAIDSARSALATLDWLQFHGYANLVTEATVVISSAHPGRVRIDLNRLTRHLRTRVRSVFVIPYDRHLVEGGEISLELMDRNTRREYLDLAASVADAFGGQQHRSAPGSEEHVT